MKESKKSRKYDCKHRSRHCHRKKNDVNNYRSEKSADNSSTVNGDTSSLDWDVDLSDSEPVNDEEGKLLSSLVRKTYIQHIHKSLLHNYDSWFKSHGDGVELSGSFIARCAAQLEKKALRACMLANLYQQSVIEQIKNIKESTCQKKLHEDLLTSLNSSKKCDKSCQTEFDNSTADILSFTPNVDPPPSNINQSTPKLNLPTSVINSSTPNALNLNTPTSSNIIDSYENTPTNLSSFGVENETMNSDPINQIFDHMRSYLAPLHDQPRPVPQPLPNPLAVSSVTPSSKFFLSYLPKNKDKLNLSESSAEVSLNKIYDPECDPVLEDRFSHLEKGKEKEKIIKRKIFNPYADIFKSDKNQIEHSFQPSPKKRKPSLEERLKTFEELFGDTCEDVPADPVPPDKAPVKGNYSKFFSMVSWKLESIAQTCELNKILLLLPPARLKYFKSCFKRLFGSNDPIVEITPEQFTHCRKRLANIIVSHLTPYFELGQIGSREVFKALAREVTRIILNETYAADVTFSQQIVDEIFQNGTKYKTLEDVNALCCR